jgi:hypothetical protein
MKALQTQFDDRRLSNAVATPTCSSCCCCCCCLATSVAASSLLAQRIGKEGEKHQILNRHLLTVVAALFVPLVGALVYIGFWAINNLLRTCTVRSYHSSSSIGRQTYTVCTNPGAGWIIPLLIIAPFLVLLYLYTRVHIKNPVKRAALVTVLIAIAFTAEFIGGAVLILTGVGGIVYLILIPLIVSWISIWYHRHIGREVSDGAVSPIQAAYPTEHITEHHDEEPPKPEELPRQGPPATSSQ